MASEEFAEFSERARLLVDALDSAYACLDHIDAKGYYESNDSENKIYQKYLVSRGRVESRKLEIKKKLPDFNDVKGIFKED